MENLLVLSGVVIIAALVTALILSADQPKTRVYDIDGASLIRLLKVE